MLRGQSRNARSYWAAGIRALHNARRSAMKARTAAMRQIHAQLITAPTIIREKYRDLSSEKRLVVLARMQVASNRTPVERAVLLVLKTLARRANELQREHERLGAELDQLVTAANPGLRLPTASDRTRLHSSC